MLRNCFLSLPESYLGLPKGEGVFTHKTFWQPTHTGPSGCVKSFYTPDGAHLILSYRLIRLLVVWTVWINIRFIHSPGPSSPMNPPLAVIKMVHVTIIRLCKFVIQSHARWQNFTNTVYTLIPKTLLTPQKSWKIHSSLHFMANKRRSDVKGTGPLPPPGGGVGGGQRFPEFAASRLASVTGDCRRPSNMCVSDTNLWCVGGLVLTVGDRRRAGERLRRSAYRRPSRYTLGDRLPYPTTDDGKLRLGNLGQR